MIRKKSKMILNFNKAPYFLENKLSNILQKLIKSKKILIHRNYNIKKYKNLKSITNQ